MKKQCELREKKAVRLTPHQIIQLIKNGKEHEIPKSKTWHRFQAHLKTHPLTVKEFAGVIGIRLPSMKKFLQGTFVIAPGNLQKIQQYLQRHEKCNDRVCVETK